MSDAKILWTKTDEAPYLASFALLPALRTFTKGTGIEVEVKNISLAGRILATVSDLLPEDQRVPDHLKELGALTQQAGTNIIKLPNISASIPQLQSAIKELQDTGFAIPDYPEEPATDEEKALQKRYAVCLGSAVNPVLREGNSDRRPAPAVKRFAQKFPHKMMKPWPQNGSRTRVGYMEKGDFFASEKSLTLPEALTARIEFVASDGDVRVLKNGLQLLKGEVLDAAIMRVRELRRFYTEKIVEAQKDGLLLSLHLKATMMKVSDPVMFGHAVSVFYKDALEKHTETLREIGANVNNGLADILKKIEKLPSGKRAQIEADIQKVYETHPDLAMVDSSKGITNLHVPNNVIIDASMPVVIRDGGKMWNKDDALQDTLAMIPDRSYATIYQTVIEDCQRHGQFDPATMGTVSNVGLMAKKAEEYGSHDKTFIAKSDGVIRCVDDGGRLLLEQTVESGDIFRMCQAKDIAIDDWVKLAVQRARAAQTPAVFWLDERRAHDREIIAKVRMYLKNYDLDDLEIHIMRPEDAIRFSLKRIRRGQDTISVTGNVLRDFLTDLFPILELGTSARMLSIVPLLKGGGLFETGAGGSAPKHVQQFLKEGHLRWDSLGEYCALVPSLEMIAEKNTNKAALVLANTLDQAVSMYLENGKSPSRKVNEQDNRGGTFYLTLYWARALAGQHEDGRLKKRFAAVAKALEAQEEKIVRELLAAQGKAMNIGGYYYPDETLLEAAMRPSATLNSILAQF